MTHGLIRIYTIPLTFDTYIDVPAHYSSIRRLLVTSDDQYLISIAESAYILFFKQTIDAFSSISNQYQFSQLSQENLEKTNEYERATKKFDYILVTKSEFEEHKRKIEEIQSKIAYIPTSFPLCSISSFQRIQSRKQHQITFETALLLQTSQSSLRKISKHHQTNASLLRTNQIFDHSRSISIHRSNHCHHQRIRYSSTSNGCSLRKSDARNGFPSFVNPSISISFFIP